MQVTVEGPAKLFSLLFLFNAGKEQEEAIEDPRNPGKIVHRDLCNNILFNSPNSILS